jgi:hypothetical protein
MKSIIAILVLTVSIQLKAVEFLTVYNENYNYTSSSVDFQSITFMPDSAKNNYVAMGVGSYHFVVAGGIKEPTSNFNVGKQYVSYDSLDYKYITHKNPTDTVIMNFSALLELYEKDSNAVKGIIYFDNIHSQIDTLTTSEVQREKDIVDEVNDSLNTSHSYDLDKGTDFISGKEVHIVPFDDTNNFSSSYLPSELIYDTYHDDGIYKLELIRDSDRNDLLVGFRYSSPDLTGVVTHFVRPNN